MSAVKNALEEINKGDCFGYLPTSSSTKPAYIANGWFHRVLGRRYDPALLNPTVVHWTQKGEVNPSDKLTAANPGVFDPFQLQGKRREFAEFRAALQYLVRPPWSELSTPGTINRPITRPATAA